MDSSSPPQAGVPGVLGWSDKPERHPSLSHPLMLAVTGTHVWRVTSHQAAPHLLTHPRVCLNPIVTQPRTQAETFPSGDSSLYFSENPVFVVTFYREEIETQEVK